MFKIGEKIVCTDDSAVREFEAKRGMVVPQLNEMYTVRGYIQVPSGEVGIILEEIVNPIIRYRDSTSEPCYNPNRFRKLDYDFAEDLLAQIKEEVMANL